jgi:pSer/pThr/pTyr-binding forkhead associated (FHA) protein
LLELTACETPPVGVSTGEVVVIGRDEGSCALVLHDPAASARHARVDVASDGSASITDLNSRNGTVVNGRRVRVAPLAAGDVVVVGGTEIRVAAGRPLRRLASLGRMAAELAATAAVTTSLSLTQTGHRWEITFATPLLTALVHVVVGITRPPRDEGGRRP